MKKLIVLVITMSYVTCVLSQKVYPTERDASNFNPGVDSIEEGLIAMAMNNPQIRATENSARSLGYEYSKSKTIYLNNITLSGNLNEYSIKEFSNSNIYNGATLYPRYNIGVNIPLGIFINNPKQTKADYYRYQAGVNQIDVDKAAIRRNVMLNYEEYKMNEKLVAFQQEVLQDARLLFAKYEEKFQKGEVTLETYTVASRSKNTEEVRFLNVERDLKASEAQLEALIGMRLDDALVMIRTKLEANRSNQ